ncbi:hypothetical protein GH810_11900 [Acetobacterium paludosum]|uniref:Uncharacterized protein n=1 Tax=Acetobacterium paludosum TaxID=52693 RepID=A0A923HXM1_9FIRM|nr:hypothetical protein [Acetobacterium paludosum]MBC3889017.1 hypothetical protein [Acetobacterium paludosum]
MKKRFKNLIGNGKRLGDLDTILNAEGFYLAMDEEQVDQFFRNAGAEMSNICWKNGIGSAIYLIFTMDTLQQDIYDSILTVIETEYLSLEAIKRTRGNNRRE